VEAEEGDSDIDVEEATEPDAPESIAPHVDEQPPAA
jgi:hypothetical protein